MNSVIYEILQANHIDELFNFHDCDYALSFVLSDRGTCIQKFTKALERSLALLRSLFRDSIELYVLIEFSFDDEYKKQILQNKLPKIEELPQLKNLQKCGLKLPYNYLAEQKTTSLLNNYRYWFEITIDDANFLAILWAILTCDLDIKPTSAISGYFIDLKRKIVAYPYDDRGMDIMALNKEPLWGLYQNYYQWLLGYECPYAKEYQYLCDPYLEKYEKYFGVILK